ncbi:TPA: hypothetical protein N0F65_012993 [Lagenidium giganteum]|uniref:Uncharacterized protein n=1 Tax=Lagenidium giganteum TaxID=4803 RepID=A0AAV2YHY6_9STRA|nr:TPA: hypothetical protein N0F65_012993 [Lagenidium giganteum]
MPMWMSGHTAYLMVVASIAAKLAFDAYFSTVSVCEMYPEFAFGETFVEEMLLHNTRLPILSLPISTVVLLPLCLIVYLLVRLHILEMFWVAFTELVAGRWLYNLLFVHIPSWLPFLFTEPGVPDLLSDEDENRSASLNEELPPRPTRAAYDKACEKLLQAKQQYANKTMNYPEDWLVYDPAANDLVLLKELRARSGSDSNLNAPVLLAECNSDEDNAR